METLQEKLRTVAKRHLNSFNDEKVEINDDTVLNTVLSDRDGPGGSNSKNIFNMAMMWTFQKNKIKIKPWPRKWIELSVTQLIEALTILLIMLMPFMSSSQMQVNLSASKTDLRKAAVTVGLSYVKSLDSIFNKGDFFIAGKNSAFSMTPVIDIQTGTADAFSSITAKATGLFMIFKQTEVEGLVTPDLDKGFHTFPISIGIETNNQFSFVNGLLEVGYVPWLQSVKQIKFGAFLQAGNKFKSGTRVVDSIAGGQIDESAEAIGKNILRAKGSLTINSPNLVSVNFFKLGLVGSADGWYDFLNGKSYYKVDATVRMFLTDAQYIDFFYQKGSGAPNFNQGDQFGLGLTFTF